MSDTEPTDYPEWYINKHGERVRFTPWPHPRHPRHLKAAGLRPVWTLRWQYPEGEIPDDITCLIGSQTISFAIGPLKSLVWLAGRDDLVNALNDPTSPITDRICTVPPSVNINWVIGLVDMGLALYRNQPSPSADMLQPGDAMKISFPDCLANGLHT
jgi:hypothetical protein